jgi:hypothetical protein
LLLICVTGANCLPLGDIKIIEHVEKHILTSDEFSSEQNTTTVVTIQTDADWNFSNKTFITRSIFDVMPNEFDDEAADWNERETRACDVVSSFI